MRRALSLAPSFDYIERDGRGCIIQNVTLFGQQGLGFQSLVFRMFWRYETFYFGLNQLIWNKHNSCLSLSAGLWGGNRTEWDCPKSGRIMTSILLELHSTWYSASPYAMSLLFESFSVWVNGAPFLCHHHHHRHQADCCTTRRIWNVLSF